MDLFIVHLSSELHAYIESKRRKRTEMKTDDVLKDEKKKLPKDRVWLVIE
jgi:hypothetical protein